MMRRDNDPGKGTTMQTEDTEAPITRADALKVLGQIRAGTAVAIFNPNVECCDVPAAIVDAILSPRIAGPTDEPPAMRDRLRIHLGDAIERMDDGARRGLAHHPSAGEIAYLARALGEVERIVRADQAADAAANPAPAINVERLSADVWNAVNDAGHPTTVADAAVAAIATVLR